MKNNMMKRILTIALILTMTMVGVVSLPSVAEAENGVVKSQEVTNAEFVTCIDAKKAPVCTLADNANVGYLFAGWYEDEALTSPISSKSGITGNVYAKFVPSHLAGIACQIDGKNGDATRNLRVVSLVHSNLYSEVGFNVYGRYDADGDKVNETEWLMYSYDSNKAQSNQLYTSLYEYSEDGSTKTKRYPEDVFGAEAKDFYFTTVRITNIGVKHNDNTNKDVDFKDATMITKPYWVTLDGTYVEGMGEFNRVNDKDNGIVNVSVNLKNASDIAAGILKVNCPNGFTLEEWECGRVFEQMAAAQSGTAINCVGNVEGMSNSRNANDIYMNLRLKANGSVTLGTNDFTVTIPDKGFCSISEEVKTDVDAWNIRY